MERLRLIAVHYRTLWFFDPRASEQNRGPGRICIHLLFI